MFLLLVHFCAVIFTFHSRFPDDITFSVNEDQIPVIFYRIVGHKAHINN